MLGLRTRVHVCCVQAALEAAELRGVEGTELTYIVAPSMENQLGVCEGLRRALSDRQRQEASELGVLGPMRLWRSTRLLCSGTRYVFLL